MVDEKRSAVMVILLNELLDSDDEKPTRGKTQEWIKRRGENGYFNNIIQELRIEDRIGFREMFRMPFLYNRVDTSSSLLLEDIFACCPVLPQQPQFTKWSGFETHQNKTFDWQIQMFSNDDSNVSRFEFSQFVDVGRKYTTKPVQHEKWMISKQNILWSCRKCWMKYLMAIKLHPTSSNTFFFFFFSKLEKFEVTQTSPTFHPTSQKCDVGWNVGLVC